MSPLPGGRQHCVILIAMWVPVLVRRFHYLPYPVTLLRFTSIFTARCYAPALLAMDLCLSVCLNTEYRTRKIKKNVLKTNERIDESIAFQTVWKINSKCKTRECSGETKVSIRGKISPVLWHCWSGVRKSTRPAKIEWWGVVVVICLERCADCLHNYGPTNATASPNPMISCLI